MNTKHYITLSILLSLSYFQVNTTLSPMQQNETTNNIQVPLESTFTIELTSNPSTGYTWKLATPIDPDYLKLLDRAFIPGNESEGLTGVPGKDIWKFQALQRGITSFELKYIRPWQEQATPAKIKKYTVTIR